MKVIRWRTVAMIVLVAGSDAAAMMCGLYLSTLRLRSHRYKCESQYMGQQGLHYTVDGVTLRERNLICTIVMM